MTRSKDVGHFARKVRRAAKDAAGIRPQTDGDPLAQYVNRPVAFMRALTDPDTGEAFEVYPAQEQFLTEALTLTPEGTLPYPELVFSAPKKSGKTALAAVAQLYIVRVIGGPHGEGYTLANSFDQAAGRVFKAMVKIIEASPLFRDEATATAEQIRFTRTKATITALSSDFAGAAGANPNVSTFDELWAYTDESAHRLWDEMVPPPTRKVATRLTATYAGFEGESELLEGLYKRGIAGEQIAPNLYRSPGLLMFWSHEPVAPWQTEEWKEQMRGQLRPNAYLRMIENRWVSSESGFVPIEWWDGCVTPACQPVVTDPQLSVWVGVDASTKRDSTAVVAVTWDASTKRVRLVWHRIWQPSPESPLDFEGTVENALLDLRGRFHVRRVRFDPYQLVSSAQRLTKAGVPMVEFPQSSPNLTEASSNLYELIKGRNLEAYADADVRLALSRAVAKETPRGWRIAKEKASHKIDVVVALAMAALAAVQDQTTREPLACSPGGSKQVNRWSDAAVGTDDRSQDSNIGRGWYTHRLVGDRLEEL